MPSRPPSTQPSFVSLDAGARDCSCDAHNHDNDNDQKNGSVASTRQELPPAQNHPCMPAIWREAELVNFTPTRLQPTQEDVVLPAAVSPPAPCMPSTFVKGFFARDRTSLRRVVLQKHCEEYISEHFVRSEQQMDWSDSGSWVEPLLSENCSLQCEEEQYMSGSSSLAAAPSPVDDPFNTQQQFEKEIQVEEHPSTIRLDEDGRLELIMGSEGHRNSICSIIVSEEIVRRLSPRWAEMVAAIPKRKRWHCKKPPRRVRMPDDDPKMMLVLMKIAHLKFADVPKHLEFDDIVELAAISSRYGTNTLLTMAITTWISPYRSRLLEPGFEEWLFIAYQFGFESEYLQLAKHIALHYPVNENRELVVPGTDIALTGNFPSNTLRSIKLARIKILAIMLNTAYEQLEAMASRNTCVANDHVQPGQIVLPNEERTSCTSLNHTGLLRYLRLHGYWPPISNTSKIKASLNKVAQNLINVHVPKVSTTEINGQPTPTHAHCDVGIILSGKVRDILDRMEWPVELGTLEELRYHASKYGLEHERIHSHLSEGSDGTSFHEEQEDYQHQEFVNELI